MLLISMYHYKDAAKYQANQHVYAACESKFFFEPHNEFFYHYYASSDWSVIKIMIKKEGFFNYLVNCYNSHVIMGAPTPLDPLAVNYTVVNKSYTYYYFRRYWVGSFRNVQTNPNFFNEVVNGNAPLQSKNVVPVLDPVAHYQKDQHNIFTRFLHPFHLVDPSPWPIATSFALFTLPLITVAFFHGYYTCPLKLIQGLLVLALILAFWWRDVIRESTYEFKHTPYVRRGLLSGILLFIISEIIFFFGFFWAFFHASLVPSQFIGGVWPPLLIQTISPWQLPLVNTLCLLLSGVTLTIAHRQLNNLAYYNQPMSLLWLKIRRLLYWLTITITLGLFFLCCQGFEYYLSPFTFQDTVFGGTFYILTGLHGLHVLVGTIFLMVCLWRASRLHFTLWKQVGFKAAVWYWHFVDVVWIFLFLVVYVWSA